MALDLLDLDDETRRFMLAELDRDEAAGPPDNVYVSPRLSPAGAASYRSLLRDALAHGDDRSFERSLGAPGMLNATETSIRKGKTVVSKMNVRAPQTMAEGELNRYYIRGLCARAIASGQDVVEVYRARQSSWARPESEALIGVHLRCLDLLEDLRTHIGSEPALMPYVNSGLSARLVSVQTS